MKNFLRLIFSSAAYLLLLSSAIATEKDKWVKSGSDYHYEQSEFVLFNYNSTEGSLNGYTLSPGGAPDGWSYVEEETRASAGTLSVSPDSSEATGTGGVKKLKLNGVASATTWIAADEAPTSFTISMGGKLTKSGEEPGSRPSWSAKANSKFFWLTPYLEFVVGVTDNPTKVKVSANGDDNKAKWSVGSTNITEANGKTSIEILFPQAGSYIVTAEALENSARSDSTTLQLVEFTKPLRNGLKGKFLEVGFRYDNQAVKSTVSPNNYKLDIAFEAAGRSDAEVKVTEGGAGGTVSGNNKYSPPNKSGSDTIELRFSDKGEEVYNTRDIVIFSSYLDRDYYNFGSNRSCDDNWKPIAHYGVAESDLPKISQWNCHGSTCHAAENSGNGIMNDTVSWPVVQKIYIPDALSGPALISTLSFVRGDVIAFYGVSLTGSEKIQHSCMALSSSKTWGANNEPPIGLIQSWKWYESSPLAYWAGAFNITCIKVLRK